MKLEVYKNEELVMEIDGNRLALADGYRVVVNGTEYPTKKTCKYCGCEVVDGVCTSCGVLSE